MRAGVYELLTQAIIGLAYLRDQLMLGQPMRRRKDRTFYINLIPFFEDTGTKDSDWRYTEYWGCCDCGLDHVVQHDIEEKRFKLWPLRPVGYDYRLRLLAGKSAPFVDETRPD
jgi:hypothetical protein